jgi:hypothetical protein
MEPYNFIYLKGEKRMNEENRELLTNVVKDRLEAALDNEGGTEEEKAEAKLAFREAMEAIDRVIELKKLDDSNQERSAQREIERSKIAEANLELVSRNALEEKKISTEAEIRKKEFKKNFTLRCIEVGGALLLAPIIETGCKKVFAKVICNFEKDYTFTTSAGRSLGGLFRFKK